MVLMWLVWSKVEIPPRQRERSRQCVVTAVAHMGEEEWYAQDTRRKDINSVNHPDLLGKTVYFIKKVG